MLQQLLSLLQDGKPISRRDTRSDRRLRSIGAAMIKDLSRQMRTRQVYYSSSPPINLSFSATYLPESRTISNSTF
jgi:hypothetical protein